MNGFRILLYHLLMSLTFSLSAQTNGVNAMQWKIAATLPAARGQQTSLGFAGPVAGVHNDVVIVAGGANFPDSMPWLGGRKKYYDDVYVLKWSNSGSLKRHKSFKLPYPVAYGASCSTPQGVVCAGGENETGITPKVLLLQWNIIKNNIDYKNLPNLPLPVTNASIACDGNTIYVAGGETPTAASAQFLRLDLNDTSAKWVTLPSLPLPVSHAMMVVQSDGNHNGIYIIGGRKKNRNGISDLYASVYSYDLQKHQWQEKKSLPYPLSAGTGVAAGSRYIGLFGGDRGETFHKTETLIAAINGEKEETKKEELNRQKMVMQSNHPGFSKKVLQYNTVTDVWSVAGSIPFVVPVTTTAIKWGNCVLLPSGEIKAGVRTPQILLGRLSPK